MQTSIPYGKLVSTLDLQNLPDGVVFSEHFTNGMAQEPPIFKKMESLRPCEMWPEGDVLVQEFTFTQYGNVPGEAFRLQTTSGDDRKWLIWTINNVQMMVGWLMTSQQFMDS